MFLTLFVVSFLSAFINFIGFLMYFRALFKNNSFAPSPVAWFLFTVMATLEFVSQYRISNLFNSINYLIGSICCAMVFVWSLRFKSTVSLTDLRLGCSALLVLLGSFVNRTMPIYELVAYNLLSYCIYFMSILNGNKEPLMPWIIWCVSVIFNIISIRIGHGLTQAYLLPVVNFSCWMIVVLLLIKQKKRDTSLFVTNP